MISSVSSQVVSVETVGQDTFPLVTVYHGVTVSVFTDSQTTTLAQAVENVNFLAGQVADYQQKELQYKSVITQKDNQIGNILVKLSDAQAAEALEKKNEVDLKKNLDDYAKKYKLLRAKGRMQIALGSIGGLLIGGGIGGLVVAVIKR